MTYSEYESLMTVCDGQYPISLAEVRRAIRDGVKEDERAALRARMRWYMKQLEDA
jgi:hypothetical protein